MIVPMIRRKSFGWLASALLTLVFGCASPSPQIGQWIGPSTSAAVSIAPAPDTGGAARLLQTPHYKIYTTIQSDEMVNRIAQLMEGSLTAYRQLAPDVPLTTYPMECYIFASRSQWAEFTRENTGEDADLYLHINRGGYTRNDWYVAYYIGDGSTISVAAHEGWHQFVWRHFKGRLPPFLEEGLATMFEGVQFKDGLPTYNLSINQNRAIALRTAIEGHWLWPLDEAIGMHAGMILNRPGERIDAWYAQAWGLGRFLWDGDGQKYRPALLRLLNDTANGTVYDPTGTHRNHLRGWNPIGVKAMFEHYLGMDFDQINEAYLRFIHHIAYEELPGESEEPG
jgi:hypothetical protein